MKLPPLHRSRSSVFFYFLLQLEVLWLIVYTIIEIIIQGLKLYYFPALNSNRDFSMVAPFLTFVLTIIEYLLAKPGNRSENPIYMIVSMIFGLGSILMEVYYFAWQPYWWSWELPFHIVTISIDGITFLFSCLMTIVFFTTPKQK